MFQFVHAEVWAKPVEQADSDDPSSNISADDASSKKMDFTTSHPVADMIVIYSTVPG